MLERLGALELLYSKRVAPAEFNWDRLWAPSIYNFMSEYHVEKLYNIASSIRYAGNPIKKEKAIKEILLPLGFKRFASGTNRVVYSYLEDTSFLLKVAIDKVGMRNSPDEFKHQMHLKPFVCKCFEVHPTGVIGTFERAMPITNLNEFLSVWDDVFEAILHMTGERIIEDIGSDFFMNWCIRKNFGPVLCDYPEVFELDGNKIFCNRPIIPGTKFPVCGHPIDYDDGFNYLVCPKCGKQYMARDLAKAIKDHDIIMKGEFDMDVMVVRGDEVLVDGRDIIGTDTIKKPEPKKIKPPKRTEVGVSIVRGDEVLLRDKSEVSWDITPEPVNVAQPDIVLYTPPAVANDYHDAVEANQVPDNAVVTDDAHMGTVININRVRAKEANTVDIEFTADPAVIGNPAVENVAKVILSNISKLAANTTYDQTEEYGPTVDKSIIDNLEASTKDELKISGEIEDVVDKVTENDASTDELSQEEEEIGYVPSDQIENPEWNKIDPDAPEPEDPDYNNINYGKEPETPTDEDTSVDESTTEEEPSPEEEEAATAEKETTTRKEYCDKEPIGSSVMANALKGFRMDAPMKDTNPPEFRKKPEVPEGLDNF